MSPYPLVSTNPSQKAPSVFCLCRPLAPTHYRPNDITFPLSPLHTGKSLFVSAIEAVCNLPSTAPALHPFLFEPTEEAANHNRTILQSHNNHLGDVIDSYPNSTISYGSEFRPPAVLKPFLSSHPLWPKLDSILTSGSTYSLVNERDPTARQADLDFLHEYGNHKSASNS